jgi:hypothetical protein
MATIHANRSSRARFQRPAPRAAAAFVAAILVVALVGVVLLSESGHRSAAAATGTAEPGSTWMALPAAGAQTHEVLAMGDSLMGNTLSQIGGIATEATFRDEHRNGSGLVSPILLDVTDPASPLVAADVFVNSMMDKWPNADTVFIEWAGACQAPCTYAYGSQAFYDAWWAMVATIRAAVVARGKTLVWAISPPAPPGGSTSPYEYNDTVSNRLSWDSRSRITGIPRADMWRALAVDDGFLGHYSQWLNYFWWPDFADHQVRVDDMVHMAPDGAYRAAWWSTIALRQAWGSSGTTSTPTTTSTTTTTTAPPTTTTSPTTTTTPPPRSRNKKPR